jgi:DUF4097 and DUF4098 domain-containing protein YvlB
MERKNRNVWIVVVVIMVVACCCLLALAAGAVGWFSNRYAGSWGQPLDLGAQGRERLEQTFETGETPGLEITNFAGAVSIRSGEGNRVVVVATKKAPSQARLDRIEVSMTQSSGRIVIRTRNSSNLGNASVDLEITAPPDSQVRVDTGAGEVNVRGISGQTDIHSGAGSVDMRSARGPVRVDLGVGQITYEGTPSGSCRFQTGAGEIVLRLAENPNVAIDLGTGLGTVDVSFAVDGSVSRRGASGTIGDGSQGSIYAHTGIGSVSVRRQ